MIETEFGRFPAVQIVTLADLHFPKLPPLISPGKKSRKGRSAGQPSEWRARQPALIASSARPRVDTATPLTYLARLR
jgi:hypothetical protein